MSTDDGWGSYVPSDWAGEVATCHACGNDAPDTPRSVRSDGPRECSPCFIGRVVNEACSEQEARRLRDELTQEIRQPSLPWTKEAV